MSARILFLGYSDCDVLDFLRKHHDVFQTSKRIKHRFVDDFNFVVSFGYRYIIPREVLSRVKNKIINLHISYLPYNRGAYPNFWSFYDNTPKGVTIHHMDDGVDTGDILFQREIAFTANEDNLSKTYNRLLKEVQDLFIEKWKDILEGNYQPQIQDIETGSSHSLNDFKFDLPNGWETRTEYVARMKEQ